LLPPHSYRPLPFDYSATIQFMISLCYHFVNANHKMWVKSPTLPRSVCFIWCAPHLDLENAFSSRHRFEGVEIRIESAFCWIHSCIRSISFATCQFDTGLYGVSRKWLN
jgi:hypothetical protein